MNPILRNVLALIAGIIAGMIFNFATIMIGMNIIPPPEGMDVMDPQSIAENVHLFEFKHFLFPFFAHALGSITAAFIAVKLAATNHMKLAIGIGIFFLFAGISNFFQIPSPTWFIVVDLTLAYIPMARLGGFCASLSQDKTL